MRVPFAILSLASLLAAAVAIQAVRDRAYPATQQSRQLLYIRSGTLLKQAALSYDALLADVYWIRAIQHFGGTRRSTDPAKRYDLLYPLLDITTTLDPAFNIAYRFGAIFLAEAYPGGAGRPDLAVRLLEKGIRARPDRWQYYQDAGFVYYWWVHDYQAAARWFTRAGEIPGAPWWLKSLAAVTLATGGDRSGARWLWQQLGQTADNEWLRSEAARRLQQLDALDAIDTLETAVRAFQRQAGRSPYSWTELVASGLIRATPVDPTGEPFLLDSVTGRVSVSPSSRLWPMPTPPGGESR